MVSEKSILLFLTEKPKVAKFDLAVKYVKVIQGSSFEQTMMGRSPRCYIPSFGEFLKVFTIYGHAGNLGHETSIMSISFHFHLPKSLHTKFG